jgi:hypothetical protein
MATIKVAKNQSSFKTEKYGGVKKSGAFVIDA